jgi:hypothetical protein
VDGKARWMDLVHALARWSTGSNEENEGGEERIEVLL